MDNEKLEIIKKLFPDHYITITEKNKQKEYLKDWRKNNPEKLKKYKGGGGGSCAMAPVYCEVCHKTITYRQFKGHLVRSRHKKKLEALNNN
jgi:hypothetical protein